MPPPLHNLSRYLSLILRHRPGLIGLALDEGGWADVDELLAAAAAHGRPFTLADLQRLVAEDEKGRYVLRDGRIRAAQGHSFPVDLGLAAQEPPPLLYHGTAVPALPSILRHGLLRRKRQYVHLSSDEETAVRVGRRHGPPVVLRIDAAAMHAAGHTFLLSENGVWLTTAVPPQYITPPDT